MKENVQRNLWFNYAVNVADGSFFGLAIGFASFTTVLPLFVSLFTQSAVLVGLIPAIHILGIQLPQLFIAKRISNVPRFKPLAVFYTIHERVPFIGLAIIAYYHTRLSPSLALVLIFILLTWQGLGAGFTGNPWQNMLAKIIPDSMRARFFGVQSAGANLLGSLAAYLAGIILNSLAPGINFAVCFLICFIILVISILLLNSTREPAREENQTVPGFLAMPLWATTKQILRTNTSFTGFLVVKVLYQFSMMSFAFYTIYAVRAHQMDEITAGLMTSILLITQVVGNPLLGWVADKWGCRKGFAIGAIACTFSSMAAWLSNGIGWFYIIFILMGIGSLTYWTIGMTYSLKFGNDLDKPFYVGMSNTLVAPIAILTPLLGGWLADKMGFSTTFLVASIFGLATTILLILFVRDPSPIPAG